MPIPPQFLKHMAAKKGSAADPEGKNEPGDSPAEDKAELPGKGKKVVKGKKKDNHSPKPDGSKLTSPFDKDGKGYNPKKDPSKQHNFLKAHAQKGKF